MFDERLVKRFDSLMIMSMPSFSKNQRQFLAARENGRRRAAPCYEPPSSTSARLPVNSSGFAAFTTASGREARSLYTQFCTPS